MADEVRELQALVRQSNLAARGDSNDEEIDSLRWALEIALDRWPEIDTKDGQGEEEDERIGQ